MNVKIEFFFFEFIGIIHFNMWSFKPIFLSKMYSVKEYILFDNFISKYNPIIYCPSIVSFDSIRRMSENTKCNGIPDCTSTK